jgi:hypothetical protein
VTFHARLNAFFVREFNCAANMNLPKMIYFSEMFTFIVILQSSHQSYAGDILSRDAHSHVRHPIWNPFWSEDWTNKKTRMTTVIQYIYCNKTSSHIKISDKLKGYEFAFKNTEVKANIKKYHINWQWLQSWLVKFVRPNNEHELVTIVKEIAQHCTARVW